MIGIDYQVIPHRDHRYPTVGDWWWTDNILHIRVSKMSDARYEMLVFLHEMIEVFLCRYWGISEDATTIFDMEYEKRRSDLMEQHERIHALDLKHECVLGKAPCGCPISEDSEPGDDIHAPYYKAHQTATLCERTLAFVLGVNWQAYDAEVTNL